MYRVLECDIELLAPNVIVQSECGQVIRSLRRHSRRITGNAHVDDQVQNDGPGMLLLDNLKNGAYVDAVYGSLKKMSARFSAVSRDSFEDTKKILQCSVTNE